ncbi:hypothetical protein Dimus_000141 [Dionaea muscipula]
MPKMPSPSSSLSPTRDNAALSYGRLKPLGSELPDPETPPQVRSRRLLLWLAVFSVVLLFLALVTATLAVVKWRRDGSSSDQQMPIKPTKEISRVCGLTRYPDLCVNSLVGFPGAMKASDQQLIHISMNVSLGRFSEALDSSMEIGNWEMGSLGRSAYEDCLELLDHSVDLIALSLSSVKSSLSVAAVDNNNDNLVGGEGDGQVNQGGTTQDVMTWLSAAMTNQDTCTEGLEGVDGPLSYRMAETLKDLSAIVSNSLAIFAAAHGGGDFGGIPIENRRRRLLGEPDGPESGYPAWVSKRDRILLETPSSQIQADVIVSQGGENGTVKTIAEAIRMAPQKSGLRFIIHVRTGRYVEKNLKVMRKKTNLWFIGDGKGQTVISGHRSVARDKITTFHTASFAVSGRGFVAKDITFENEAGPESHQAVALRVGADHVVVYRCEIKGYQDTLYTHSQRQFYRECDIYGTVDFIFGNAAVVFQNCTMYARKPMALQKITITAQSRKEAQMPTGMSIHACQIRPDSDLDSVKSSFPTYLGRPWKPYSRVVYMLSYIGDHVDPRGWLEWNATAPVDKLYYGEYSNYGPGSGTEQRVNWTSVHPKMSVSEANAFTVGEFIYGSSWLTPTGVAFQAGLTG